MRHCGPLVFAGDLIDHLTDILSGGIAPRGLDGDRVTQEGIGKLLDFRRKRGREHQTLTILGQQVDDALQIRQKTHVEHAVGFVKHQRGRLRQVDGLLFDVIKQPARRGNDHFHTGAQGGRLGFHVDAAKHHHRAQRRVPRVGRNVGCHLVGELARRRQDQGPYRMARRRGAVAGQRQQLLDDGQGKTGSLAGPGLGSAHDVASAQHYRNSLHLNGRRNGVALVGQRPEDARIESEIVKRYRGCFGAGSFCGRQFWGWIHWSEDGVMVECPDGPGPRRGVARSSLNENLKPRLSQTTAHNTT